ncbi:ZinT/AdcA family metal-binding protein [Helcococcus ovis]|nr:ZinT/AdcA family metal-binding protein [Helcococcus ovis]WNZ01697.1 ZinT/AdcA family metal-binding protein [Helcococcus ovis]
MKKSKLVSVVSILALAVVLSACGNKKDNKKPVETKVEQKVEKKDDKKVDKKETNKSINLDKWAGKWVNYASFADTKEVKDAFASLENGDKEYENFKKRNEVGFNALEAQGNKLKFYDMAKDGKVISESEYEYIKDHKTKHGKREAKWHEFKAKDPNAKFPVILLMQPHGEEVMLHYHFKVGKDGETILKDKSINFGTFVKEDIKPSQIANAIKIRFERQKAQKQKEEKKN